MDSKYFALISSKLCTLLDEDQTKLQLYQFDVKFLEILCRWFKAWDYIAAADEQGKEINLRSVITHIKRIWVDKKDNNLEDFNLVSFGLERKIQQSKLHIEKWCQLLLCSSSSKSSTNLINIIGIVKSVHCKVHLYNLPRYRASEIDPFNQIDILKDKLDFMLGSLSRVRECIGYKESCKNFVDAFSINAACLVCLYWARTKEATNEGSVRKVNNALFHMLHKIKPYAAHVTGMYFHVLKSSNLPQDHEGLTLARFVDFFFQHTILKEDFMILKERLIVLLKFLTDPPRENAAAAEESLIRNQIYALFHEDAYLLLPINEMKQAFSKKEMLLSEFMNKIDILIAKISRSKTAKIIPLYCRPADSWNRLETEKMNNMYFASLQREISLFKKHAHCPSLVLPQLHLYIKELRFLSLFLQCFETWDDSDEQTSVWLNSMFASLQRIWGQEYDMRLLSRRLYAIRKGATADWQHLLDSELKEKFHMSKQEINAWVVSLSHCSFHCRHSKSNKTLKFLNSIFYNMTELVNHRACKDVAFKKQIEILEEKLLLLKNLLKLTTKCTDSKNLEEFTMLAQVFANNAACLLYLYWAEATNGEILVETNLILSNMLQKIKPNTSDVARMYIGTLKVICLQPCDYLLLEQTVTSFVAYFFEDMVTPWKNDFQILQDEVIFYLTFVHHHHTGNVEEIICRKLDVLFSDSVYDLLPFDDMKGDFSKKNVGLSDFMMNIRLENAKIRQLYCKFPDSFVYNFPRIIGQGFLDCLIHKLRNLTERMIIDQKYVPLQIIAIEEELVSLTPIFIQILEVTDLNDTWLEVVNVAYLAEHVISLSVIFYNQICHYIPHISDVVDRIKAVRTNLETMEECNMYNDKSLPHLASFMSKILEQDRTSEIPGVVVGFEVDEKIILDNITRGTESLDIVSIVGMGGLGKTTLAKKVYGSSSVKSHFNIFAFTYVSHDHSKRRILLDILREVDGVDAKTFRMSEDDLAHKLKKCLSRQKYFVVLDDIWNINVWDDVRSSFPDDRNGSRVMFTTRSLEVAKRGQINCSPHCLRFLTEDESWMLLQKKALYTDMPPPNVTDIAKLIAKKCGGLPLAIVVIAGLLARTETSRWIHISKRVSSYLFNEGCMNILELSYKHLPEYLKPCLLHLGAFPGDGSYKVRQVTLLWIAEGFIKESRTKSLNEVAKEYLYELVDRSLIIVDEMIIGEIRTFRVHDLIHDFCQKKCVDMNFFQLGHGTASSSLSAPLKDNHYRVSVQKQYQPSLTYTRSLLCFPSKFDYYNRIFPLSKFRFAKVLYLKGTQLQISDFSQVTSLIDLRHIECEVDFGAQSIPSSICNLWNIQSLILKTYEGIYLPETLWRMKSLRYVKVCDCKLEVSDGYEPNAYHQLDKVVSFSRPYLSTGKDVEWLLKRLPAVRELCCILDYKSVDCTEERVETFDFHSKLESLKLRCKRKNCPYLISFPSTLVKLTLEGFQLPWTSMSAIAELQCLKILKLRDVSFPGQTWEMEDVTFLSLKYFELRGSTLKLWNANNDSFPCMEQLYFYCTLLEELPASFGEISSLKKITIVGSLRYTSKLKCSALRVQEEQMELGNKVELLLNCF